MAMPMPMPDNNKSSSGEAPRMVTPSTTTIHVHDMRFVPAEVYVAPNTVLEFKAVPNSMNRHLVEITNADGEVVACSPPLKAGATPWRFHVDPEDPNVTAELAFASCIYTFMRGVAFVGDGNDDDALDDGDDMLRRGDEHQKETAAAAQTSSSSSPPAAPATASPPSTPPSTPTPPPPPGGISKITIGRETHIETPAANEKLQASSTYRGADADTSPTTMPSPTPTPTPTPSPLPQRSSSTSTSSSASALTEVVTFKKCLRCKAQFASELNLERHTREVHCALQGTPKRKALLDARDTRRQAAASFLATLPKNEVCALLHLPTAGGVGAIIAQEHRRQQSHGQPAVKDAPQAYTNAGDAILRICAVGDEPLVRGSSIGLAPFGTKAADALVRALDGASEGTSFLGEPSRTLEKATMQQLQAPMNRSAAAALLAERQVVEAWSRERERQSVAASLALEAELGIGSDMGGTEPDGHGSGMVSSSANEGRAAASDDCGSTKASRRRNRKAKIAAASAVLAADAIAVEESASAATAASEVGVEEDAVEEDQEDAKDVQAAGPAADALGQEDHSEAAWSMQSADGESDDSGWTKASRRRRRKAAAAPAAAVEEDQQEGAEEKAPVTATTIVHESKAEADWSRERERQSAASESDDSSWAKSSRRRRRKAAGAALGATSDGVVDAAASAAASAKEEEKQDNVKGVEDSANEIVQETAKSERELQSTTDGGSDDCGRTKVGRRRKRKTAGEKAEKAQAPVAETQTAPPKPAVEAAEPDVTEVVPPEETETAPPKPAVEAAEPEVTEVMQETKPPLVTAQDVRERLRRQMLERRASAAAAAVPASEAPPPGFSSEDAGKNDPSAIEAQALAMASADDLDTDEAISGGSRGVGRTLQKWVADDNAPKLEGLGTFSSSTKTWDQFEANERMYGVKGGFDESLYTTSLDKEGSKISEEEAARIAAEIGKGGGAGGKVPTRDIDDLGEDDVDEEDKFSSVLADGRATKQNFDERNEETFGAAASSETEEEEEEEEAAPSPESTPPPAAKSALNENAESFTLSATAKPFVPPSPASAAAPLVEAPSPVPYGAYDAYGMPIPGPAAALLPNGMPVPYAPSPYSPMYSPMGVPPYNYM
ncbi:hypothetical protein PPROV_000574000 [Pycnococcus provasolii]|uniref:C2H2-type domain-containing protein n=1 Tax=Pycnococcus provasolii TaxID=41880 RepID=A0A830HPQ3_9CHLO|nr:hypothetical protein PPROV_000574000 [Pycnococcus provasolii]